MLENLVGYRLIEIDNNGFKVKKDDDTKTFEFDKCDGECCGYSEITTNLLISKDELANNPIITEVDCVNPQKMHIVSYEECEKIIITFMGECKPIAEINSESGSGSGYYYGAHAWVRCKETNETETLTEW